MRTIEPMWWLLFSAGGTVAALLFPALMVLTGLAVPAGWISAADLHAMIDQPLTRLLLFGAIALPLLHGVHRIRHTLAEMGLKPYDRLLALVCYGGAILGTIAAAVLLVWR